MLAVPGLFREERPWGLLLAPQYPPRISPPRIKLTPRSGFIGPADVARTVCAGKGRLGIPRTDVIGLPRVVSAGAFPTDPAFDGGSADICGTPPVVARVWALCPAPGCAPYRLLPLPDLLKSDPAALAA